MSTVERRHGMPLLVVVLGALGAGCVTLGLLGIHTPDAVGFLPVLREQLVASALIATGAVFMAIETIVILVWARRRRDAAPGIPTEGDR
jgi:hypothetical protein